MYSKYPQITISTAVQKTQNFKKSQATVKSGFANEILKPEIMKIFRELRFFPNLHRMKNFSQAMGSLSTLHQIPRALVEIGQPNHSNHLTTILLPENHEADFFVKTS